MESFGKAHVEALELLVRAGRVPVEMPWTEAIPQAADFILALAQRIDDEKDTKEDKRKRP